MPFPSVASRRPSKLSAAVEPPSKARSLFLLSTSQRSTRPGILPTARSLPSPLNDRLDTEISEDPPYTAKDLLVPPLPSDCTGPRTTRLFSGLTFSPNVKSGFGNTCAFPAGLGIELWGAHRRASARTRMKVSVFVAPRVYPSFRGRGHPRRTTLLRRTSRPAPESPPRSSTRRLPCAAPLRPARRA